MVQNVAKRTLKYHCKKHSALMGIRVVYCFSPKHCQAARFRSYHGKWRLWTKRQNKKNRSRTARLGFWQFSSKLYQKTYDDSYGEDLRSTDPREGFYHKKDGEVNPNCSRLWEKWKQLLSDNKETFDRCLRLHLCLPDVKPVTSRGRKERLWVEKGWIDCCLHHPGQREKHFF